MNFKKKKGITPVVSIVILLLIAVAISGAAYTYILGYWTGLTGKGIEIQSISCSGLVTQVDSADDIDHYYAMAFIRNIGQDAITFDVTNAAIPTGPSFGGDLTISRDCIGAGTQCGGTAGDGLVGADPWALGDEEQYFINAVPTVAASEFADQTGVNSVDINPNSAKKIYLECAPGSTCRYSLIIGGRVTTTQVSC